MTAHDMHIPHGVRWQRHLGSRRTWRTSQLPAENARCSTVLAYSIMQHSAPSRGISSHSRLPSTLFPIGHCQIRLCASVWCALRSVDVCMWTLRPPAGSIHAVRRQVHACTVVFLPASYLLTCYASQRKRSRNEPVPRNGLRITGL